MPLPHTSTSLQSKSGHYQHLAETLSVLHTAGVASATDILATTFRNLAEARGVPEQFNMTLTYCWTHLVDVALAACGRSETLEVLVLRCPALLDKDLPLRFYNRDTLFSDAARRGFLAPDLMPLPGYGRAPWMGADGIDRES